MLLRIEWRWVLRGACAVSALVLGGNLAREMVVRLSAQPSSKPVPYTVVLREMVYDTEGRGRQAALFTRAVRSDGSVAERLGEAGSGSREIYLANGTRINVSDLPKLKSTITTGVRWHPHVLAPETKCTQTIDRPPDIPGAKRMELEFLGEEVIAGYRTARIRHGKTISWHALEYGCAMVQSLTDFGDRGRSEKRLIALTPGEPDSLLFAAGEEYKEVPPSAHFAPPGRDCGPECESDRALLRQRLDDHYYKHR